MLISTSQKHVPISCIVITRIRFDSKTIGSSAKLCSKRPVGVVRFNERDLYSGEFSEKNIGERKRILHPLVILLRNNLFPPIAALRETNSVENIMCFL